MKGKNKGRTLPPRRPKYAASSDPGETSASSPSPSTSSTSSSVPARVGSDLSFWLVAGQGVHPSVLTPIIKCRHARQDAISAKALSSHPPPQVAIDVKPAMYLLQFYIDFPRNPSSWCEALNSDPAYLNAVLSASHAYFDYLSGFPLPTAHQRLHASRYLSRCLQILRQRLSNEHDNLRLADTTAMTVLSLASFSTRVRQDETSYHHLRGLRDIIELRGGIRSMRGNPKLLIETFR